MKCWKCGQTLAAGTVACPYCGAMQNRPAPVTEMGRSMRAMFDHYGAETVLSNEDFLVNGLGDLPKISKKQRSQLSIAMEAGLGRLYLEQLKGKGPDAAFDSRVRLLLTQEAGLNETAAAELAGLLDEMIGWRQDGKAAVRPRRRPYSSKILGIDLGGSTARIAVAEGGGITMIPNLCGGFGHPSAVALRDGRLIVCEEAMQQAIASPDETTVSFKRLMGADRNVPLGEQAYSPQFLSALILRKLREDADEYLGEECRAAVITVPNGYTSKQRRAVIDAGRMAGLDVKRLINNTSAAVLNYGCSREGERAILVCSMGSTGFDVCVAVVGDGVAEIIASGGDSGLGGNNFTDCVAFWILDQLKEEEGIDLSEDPVSMARVREAAEAAKKELSGLMSAQIFIPNVALRSGKPIHFRRSLSRAVFNNLTAQLRERARDLIQSVLNDSVISSDDIGQILFVGGSSRIPALRDAVRQILGKDISQTWHPEDCTARGAAVQAGVLNGDVKDTLLLEATTHSLGVETAGGVCTKLIKRNTAYPAMAKQSFSTSADNQTTVDVHLLEGESEKAKENETLGWFQITGIPAAAKGVPNVEITIDIDANGIVRVLAEDTGTGTQHRLTSLDRKGMSDQEIQNAANQVEQIASAW